MNKADLMKKILSIKNSSGLFKKELDLVYREAYLNLQRFAIHCLARANAEEKKQIKNQIQGVGETYLKAKARLSS